jgi:hypothetical protein
VSLTQAPRGALAAATKMGEPSPAVHAVRQLVEATVARLA